MAKSILNGQIEGLEMDKQRLNILYEAVGVHGSIDKQLAIINARISACSAVTKTANAILAMHKETGVKDIVNTRQRMIATNLISDKESIVAITCTEEKFQCPAQGHLFISRYECLDYSGDEHHINTCQHCDQFTITRKQTCP